MQIKAVNMVIRILAVSLVAVSISSCQPNVYASVGTSSFGGHRGGLNTSISVGGRICC
jgi:hypothetical protein